MTERQESESADGDASHGFRPRRVLHVMDLTGPGGAQTVLLNLVRALDRAEWQPVVAIPGHGWLSEQLDAARIAYAIVPTRGTSFDWRYLVALIRTVAKYKIDLIHAHLLGPAVYCGLAGLMTRLPVVTTFHGQVDVSPRERFRRLKFSIINRACHTVVFVSNALREFFLKCTNIDPTRTDVIYNGVDFRATAPSRNEALRRELGATEGDIVIGAIGHVRPPKAYEVFIEATAILAARSPRYRFVIVGGIDDPGYAADLRTQCDRRGVTDRIFFAGFRDDVTAILANFDVYVISSRHEGLSLATIEALAAGLPVVATRSGGPEEIVEHEHTGILVPVGDPHSIADAVERVAHDPEAARRMGAQGRHSVTHVFALERMVSQYDATYRRALDSNAMPGSQD